jgi:hypothetical protein
MQHRQNGVSQEVAAAKADISVPSGRRIETSTQKPRVNTERQWRTREDPLEAVWETALPIPCWASRPAKSSNRTGIKKPGQLGCPGFSTKLRKRYLTGAFRTSSTSSSSVIICRISCLYWEVSSFTS